jgi:hypothetical protein
MSEGDVRISEEKANSSPEASTNEENRERKLLSRPSGIRKLPPIPSQKISTSLNKGPSHPSPQNNMDVNEEHLNSPKIMMEKLRRSSDVDLAKKLQLLLASDSSSASSSPPPPPPPPPLPLSSKKAPPPLPKRPMVKPLPKIPQQPQPPQQQQQLSSPQNPSTPTPKVTARGPLPKRPTHRPPPPPYPKPSNPAQAHSTGVLTPVPENQVTSTAASPVSIASSSSKISFSD